MSGSSLLVAVNALLLKRLPLRATRVRRRRGPTRIASPTLNSNRMRRDGVIGVQWRPPGCLRLKKVTVLALKECVFGE